MGVESDIAAGMDRDAILAELLDIEGMLLDARLSDEDRHALHGAAQALRHVPDAATWQPASQRSITWVNRPSEAGSALVSASFHPSQTLHRRLIALAVLFKPAPFDHLPRQCHRAYRLTAA